MIQTRPLTLAEGSRRRCLALSLATALLAPTPASAFFQTTKLEGAVGTDIGGVWLSVHHLMPEFRISYPRPAAGPPVPLEVGPIPADLEPLTGKNPTGVSIVKCTDPGFCAENGLLVGDILIKINSTDLKDVASFENAVPTQVSQVLLSVRRPALKMTTTRLLKIRYQAKGAEAEGSTVAEEELGIHVLDVKLPFAEDVETSRQSHNLFHPSAEVLAELSKSWFELPNSTPLLYLNGTHRFVAQSNFDEALAADQNLAKAKFAVIMDMQGNPIRGAGGKVIDVYGVEEIDARTLAGSFVTVTIASAPFPINIEFKGRFQMTKVAEWSLEDDKVRAKREAAREPAEDLSKFKTLPDVPPTEPADKAK
ncbi:MAG: hypothetical protein ABR538_16235 [Candidatus Binatia bacterium]